MKIGSSSSPVRRFPPFLNKVHYIRPSCCGSIISCILMSFSLSFTDYNGCNLNSQEIACIGVMTAEAIAVLICDQQCKDESCKDLCKKIAKIAEDRTCKTPKQFMCNLDNCPQNWKNPQCQGVAVAGR